MIDEDGNVDEKWCQICSRFLPTVARRYMPCPDGCCDATWDMCDDCADKEGAGTL